MLGPVVPVSAVPGIVELQHSGKGRSRRHHRRHRPHHYKGGATALIRASLKGHIEVVKLLLDRGSDVNERDSGGATALMFACENGIAEIMAPPQKVNFELVRLLQDRGADMNCGNEGGFTALMMAHSPPCLYYSGGKSHVRAVREVIPEAVSL